MQEKIHFLKQSISNFRDTGSVTPSSTYLARRLAAPIILGQRRKNDGGALDIVELGAGTGSVTRFLLEILPRKARLVSFEINPDLARKLKTTFVDQRLTVVEGDAAQMSLYLKKLHMDKADHIVSGLPLGNFRRPLRHAIFSEIYACLKPEGTYTQFQYFLANFAEIRRLFHMSDVAFEWRNFPPAFVYTCGLR